MSDSRRGDCPGCGHLRIHPDPLLHNADCPYAEPVPWTVAHERFQHRRVYAMGRYTRESMQRDRTKDVVTGELVERVTALVLAKHIRHGTDTQEVRYPATWWQHFKQAHFPDWALKRWPVFNIVEQVHFDYDQYALFPEADLPFWADHLGNPRIEISVLVRKRE